MNAIRTWAVLTTCSGIFSIVLGCAGVGSLTGPEEMRVIGMIVVINGLLLVACGRQCLQIHATVEEQARRIKVLEARFDELDEYPDAAPADTRFQPDQPGRPTPRP
jgi:hypothetical protein